MVTMLATNIKFPIQFNPLGETTTNKVDDHVRDMIELVLFTNPGERVNRPEFGCGILHNIFAGNSEQLAAALQATMSSNLNRWLGDVINVQNLDVTTDDARLVVTLNYTIIATGELRTDAFDRRDI